MLVVAVGDGVVGTFASLQQSPDSIALTSSRLRVGLSRGIVQRRFVRCVERLGLSVAPIRAGGNEAGVAGAA